MPSVKPFALDQWLAAYQPLCKYFLHDSCVAPLTIKDLKKIGQDAGQSVAPIDEDLVLSYGPIRGSTRLRGQIAALYKTKLDADDVLVCGGAISANYLLLSTLLGPGDHVIVSYPTYGQLFDVAKLAGAEVSLWGQTLVGSDESGHSQVKMLRWELNLMALRGLIKANTKMIVINNPSNPTGLVIDHTLLNGIVELARSHGLLVFSDEVFRPLFHGRYRNADKQPPSLLDLGYERSLVTGSFSKSLALPGIRVGWVAVHPSLRQSLLQSIVHARDYTTISVSQVDDQIASFVLNPPIFTRILERSWKICDMNLKILDSWIESHKPYVSWVRPDGAGTCVIQIMDNSGVAVDDAEFAEALAKEEGVLAPPAGLTFGYEPEYDGTPTNLRGGLRVGIVLREGMLEEGLAGIERLIARRFNV